MADDPDPSTRAELADLLARGNLRELEDRFRHPLTFGTAGLRGPLGAGPARMNRLVVRRTTTGLARWLLDGGPAASGGVPGARPGEVGGGSAVPRARLGEVVVGHDARHGSAELAAEAARSLIAAGLRARTLSRPLPTPLLAFAVRHLSAQAGVMITASHNPAADNGYKVYLADGAQVLPPFDEAITAAATAPGPAAAAGQTAEAAPWNGRAAPEALPSVEARAPADAARPGQSTPPGPVPSTVEPLDEEDLIGAYQSVALGLLDSGGPRRIDAVYTPLHGVGGTVLPALVEAAGFPPLCIVACQGEPDPDFPTVAFPNPEEPGVLDLAIALAEARHADIVIANDPDADRLAVAAPRRDGTWRRLSGDEVGILLADRLLATSSGPGRLVATSIVSSTMLASLARWAGVAYEETLTGFKWIARAALTHPGHRLLFGYEEALGYAVTDAVADKDGMTAALVMLELAALSRAEGRSLQDRLDELSALLGVHHNAQWTWRFDGSDAPEQIRNVMAAWRTQVPAGLGGLQVTDVVDLAKGGTLPPADVVVVRLGQEARVVLRPSGTEPKLKVYIGATTEPPGLAGLPSAQRHAAAVVAAVTRDVAARCQAERSSDRSS